MQASHMPCTLPHSFPIRCSASSTRSTGSTWLRASGLDRRISFLYTFDSNPASICMILSTQAHTTRL